jgi:hypothetical protein
MDQHSLLHLAKLNIKDETFAWYFDCGDYFYIMTSFGSQTLTSDFDFSVYRIKKNTPHLTSEMELTSIKKITKEMFDVGEYVKLQKCHEESMQKCFDSNGYPEIMVYYKGYFRDLTLNDDADLRESRYANVVSSKIIRYCVVSQIYMIRALDAFDERGVAKDEFHKKFRDCYYKLWESTRGLVTINNFTLDLNQNELVSDTRDPNDPKEIKKKYYRKPKGHRRAQYNAALVSEFGETVKSYQTPSKDIRLQFLVNAYRMLNYFRTDEEAPDTMFKKCVNMVDNPTQFLDKMYDEKLDKNVTQYFKMGKTLKKRKMQHNGKMYEVYDEVFYVPESWERRPITSANPVVDNESPQLQLDDGSNHSDGGNGSNVSDEQDKNHSQRDTIIIHENGLNLTETQPKLDTIKEDEQDSPHNEDDHISPDVDDEHVSPNIEHVSATEVDIVPDVVPEEQMEMINRLLLPFLGACHIWADEAYVTFGALEFVKNEKEIIKENPTVILRCDTYVETYFENMGMMLLHVIEEAKHRETPKGPNLMKKRVANYQMISDAYSKYLRRSLLAIELPCLNDFGVQIDSFFKKEHSFRRTILTHKVFKFYRKIKNVDQSAKDKKDQYYTIFKKHWGSVLSVSALIRATFRFHFLMSDLIFFYYDTEKVLKKPNRREMRERVLVD